MAILRLPDLAGIITDGEIMCLDCIRSEDNEIPTWDNTISIDEVQDDEILYLCDFCKQQL